MPDRNPNARSKKIAVPGAHTTDLAELTSQRILIVDRCSLDYSIKGARLYLVVVMDTASRCILASAVASDATMADSMFQTLQEAIATDPDTLVGASVECDFCDAADLHSRIDGIAPYTRIAVSHVGLRARGWAERRLREAALKANPRH